MARTIQTNLLTGEEKARLIREREARGNPFISEEYYSGPYARRKMIAGLCLKRRLGVIARRGSHEAKRALDHILEAERMLWGRGG